MKKIYIVHGWAYSIDKWDDFCLELQKRGFETKILKVPGLIYKLDKTWDLNDYLNWLEKELKSEKEKLILLGHSNGGRISIAFAKKHPDRIKQLILIDSACVYHNELPIRLKRSSFKILAKIGKRFTSSDQLKKILYKIARTSDYNEADSVMKKTMLNLLESDKNRYYENLDVSTMIVWGEKDKVTPISDGRIIKDNVRRSKLFVIPEAKHSPQFTHPKQVADIIKANL